MPIRNSTSRRSGSASTWPETKLATRASTASRSAPAMPSSSTGTSDSASARMKREGARTGAARCASEITVPSAPSAAGSDPTGCAARASSTERPSERPCANSTPTPHRVIGT